METLNTLQKQELITQVLRAVGAYLNDRKTGEKK